MDDARWTRAVEGTWYRGMTFTPEVSSIERYLTIPLDFCPALYSINALMGVAEGVDEEKGETWRTSWAVAKYVENVEKKSITII